MPKRSVSQLKRLANCALNFTASRVIVCFCTTGWPAPGGFC